MNNDGLDAGLTASGGGSASDAPEAFTAAQCILALLVLGCIAAGTVWAATFVAPLLR